MHGLPQFDHHRSLPVFVLFASCSSIRIVKLIQMSRQLKLPRASWSMTTRLREQRIIQQFNLSHLRNGSRKKINKHRYIWRHITITQTEQDPFNCVRCLRSNIDDWNKWNYSFKCFVIATAASVASAVFLHEHFTLMCNVCSFQFRRQFNCIQLLIQTDRYRWRIINKSA